MCDYPNKDFSGVGIVYKVCQALDDRLSVNYADDYLDLLAVGLIADSMDSRSLESRYYMVEGLKHIRNPFLKALVEKQDYSLKGVVNIMNVAFYISPLINGNIRYGSMEEKRNMFKAMLEDRQDETLPYKKRGAKETIEQPIAVAMARISANVKSRQDNARKKCFKILKKKIEDKRLADNKVLIVDGTDIITPSLTGLVAMQLAQEYQKPTLILSQHKDKETDEIFFSGSGRNFNHSPIQDFRGYLLNLNLFNFVEGHDSAFGFKIGVDNLLEANERLNKLLKDVSFDKTFDVDFEIPVNNLKPSFITAFNVLEGLWGRFVEKPDVAVTNININTKDIQLIGKRKNTIKFISNGIEFVNFRSSEDEYDEIVQYPNIDITLVGRPAINRWAGKEIPQILISDMEFKEASKYDF